MHRQRQPGLPGGHGLAEVEVTGADISADALAVARINVDRHELAERVQLLESDGLAALPGPWDLVLCNPPYVNADSMSRLPAEYQAEPELALAGGADGMDFIRRLLQDLPSRLAKEGVVVLEIGNEKDFFEAAFPDLPVFWLDTSSGDEQVLLITQEALRAWTEGDIEALRPTYRPWAEMDLRALRYFIAVLEAGSLSRAAHSLYVAQPALTAQIKKLEGELGAQLLERSHAGVTPTPAGAQLYEDARRLLSDADAMRERIQRLPQGPEGSVTIALPFC